MPRTLGNAPVAGQTLSSSSLVQWGGLYPPFYPGPTAFPGRGTNPIVGAILDRPALFPPFYPSSTAFPGRGSHLTTEAA